MAKERFVLCPCSGRHRLNIPRGHVYHVKDKELQQEVGFITLEVAEKKYGKENCFVSQSDSLCPICSADIHNPENILLIKE